MKARVLVVEDHAANRELLCDWLQAEGYEVLAAANLTASMAAMHQHRPQAVLLDIKLGAEDGLTLAQWIRQQPSLQHTPVIAVTAHAMLSERERIFHAGCQAYVSKPVDFRLLREELHRWIQASRSTPG